MSGKATGWVFDHGPRPTDTAADGSVYGNRARGLRLVMLAVADSANLDGEGSHPGIENVSLATLYSPGQSRRLLRDLVDDGWLEVTEKGGGRGRADEFRIPGVKEGSASPAIARRETRAPCAGSGVEKRAHGGAETRASGPLNARMAAETRASGCAPNGLPNGKESNGRAPNVRASESSNGSAVSLFETAAVAAEGAAREVEKATPDPFDAFWTAWPSARRNDKPKCRAKFAAIVRGGVPAETIVAGAVRHVRWWEREETDPRTIPLTTTWLNQARWEHAEPFNPRKRSATPRADAKDDVVRRQVERMLAEAEPTGSIIVNEVR